MGFDKIKRLEQALSSLKQRWGERVLLSRHDQSNGELPHISTGFPKLDDALCIGGIPRGCITQFVGAPTSGMTTLALKVLARAQRDGDMVVYFDLNNTFDADYAVQCGVKLAQLLIVRPKRNALDMAYIIATNRGAGVILLDLTMFIPNDISSTDGLIQLARELPFLPCAFLLLTSPTTGRDFDSHANQVALRLHIQRMCWLKRRGDVQGYRSAVTILKSRFSPTGRKVGITIGFRTIVKGGRP